jgi:signal transduction histidine kinase
VSSPGELVVVVAAPTGRDARLICGLLSRRGILCEGAPSVADLCRSMETGVGAVVLAEEVLVPHAIDRLSAAFAAQPKWSDIELILLTSNANRTLAGVATTLHAISTRSVVVLERPVRALTLASTVVTALNSRRRQLELRDDLEERARQEERLRRTQKLESIGVLAAGIAHTFNNLLAVVLGNATLAADSLPPRSSAREWLNSAIEATGDAARLTAQLLAYAGKGRFFTQSLDLSEEVRQIGSLLQASIPPGVDLRLELARDLPPIEADAGQLQQVVLNFVSNAAEAIPVGRPGTVRIATGTQDVGDADSRFPSSGTTVAPGRYVVLEVSDSGIGMDAATLSRIFDPFFTTKFTGRGLGLAAVLGIVRGHNGGIGVSSTPGQGTTLEALFPATARV